MLMHENWIRGWAAALSSYVLGEGDENSFQQ